VEPWNKGRAVGPKRPLSPDQVRLIRTSLEAGEEWRDLAMFSMAIDTMLRAVDLLRLRVDDVVDDHGRVVDELPVRQQKTATAHLVALTERTRSAVEKWLTEARKQPGDFLFTGFGRVANRPLTRRHYSELVKRWAKIARVKDVSRFATHSLRRTKAAYIYEMTRNPEVVRQLLGHKSLSATSAYLDIDKAKAIAVARKFEI
jgi:integrase